MSLPRLSLPEAGVGLGIGAAFGFLMGGASSAGIGAMAGLAFAAASAKRDEREGKKTGSDKPLSEKRAQDRRRFFVRSLCSARADEVSKVARGFRLGGALSAARALRQHVLDLQAVAAKSVDEAAIDRFVEIVTLAREQFHDESNEVKAAVANLDAARARVGTSADGI